MLSLISEFGKHLRDKRTLTEIQTSEFRCIAEVMSGPAPLYSSSPRNFWPLMWSSFPRVPDAAPDVFMKHIANCDFDDSLFYAIWGVEYVKVQYRGIRLFQGGHYDLGTLKMAKGIIKYAEDREKHVIIFN